MIPGIQILLHPRIPPLALFNSPGLNASGAHSVALPLTCGRVHHASCSSDAQHSLRNGRQNPAHGDETVPAWQKGRQKGKVRPPTQCAPRMWESQKALLIEITTGVDGTHPSHPDPLSSASACIQLSIAPRKGDGLNQRLAGGAPCFSDPDPPPLLTHLLRFWSLLSPSAPTSSPAAPVSRRT